MDLRAFEVEDTGVLELMGPDDKPLLDEEGRQITVTLYGPGSREYKRAEARQQNRLIDKLRKRGKTEESAEDKARDQADFLAGCTVGFSDNVQVGDLQGAALFKAIYANPKLGFILDQVAKHVAEWGNFTKGSTTI
jgi:hypothetical protein